MQGPGQGGQGGSGVVPVRTGGTDIAPVTKVPTTVLSEPSPPAQEAWLSTPDPGTDGGWYSRSTPTDLGTIAGTGPSGGVWFALAAVIAALVVGAGLWLVIEPPAGPAAASTEEVARPGPPAPVLDDGLLALAAVNAREPGRVLPFDRRHALLAQLDDSEEAPRVDRRLNLALDLLQARDSEAPCTTFGTALDRIEAAADSYYVEALRDGRAPEASCEALDTRREALLARLTSPATSPKVSVAEEPEPEPEPERRRHSRSSGKGKKKRTSGRDEPAKTDDGDNRVGGKLHDGLLPFGK